MPVLLIRRLRALWTALVGALRRAPRAALVAPGATVEVEPEDVLVDMSSGTLEAGASASVVAAVARPEVARPAGPREVLRAGAAAEVSVRQFFAQVATAAPDGLQVDFSVWQVAKVERFFLAMSRPERGQQRGAALADEVGLERAFDGFQWD